MIFSVDPALFSGFCKEFVVNEVISNRFRIGRTCSYVISSSHTNKLKKIRIVIIIMCHVC
jgi:hypothetical protein